MEKKISKKGRIIIDLDGYSEYYKAYIRGAITGKVSFPRKYEGKDTDMLIEWAKDCLLDRILGTDNCKYFGAKIVRKMGKVY